MTNKQKSKIKEQLLTKIAELNGASARRDELITERSNDPYDQMQSRVDLDLTISVINTDWRTKKAVESALKVLETDQYGICVGCGDEINPKRLEAIPWTTMCVACQEDHDLAEREAMQKFDRAA